MYRNRANSLETDSFPAVKMATISSCLLEIGNYFSRVSAVKIANIIYSHKYKQLIPNSKLQPNDYVNIEFMLNDNRVHLAIDQISQSYASRAVQKTILLPLSPSYQKTAGDSPYGRQVQRQYTVTYTSRQQ